jgi:hypothetical protein
MNTYKEKLENLVKDLNESIQRFVDCDPGINIIETSSVSGRHTTEIIISTHNYKLYSECIIKEVGTTKPEDIEALYQLVCEKFFDLLLFHAPMFKTPKLPGQKILVDIVTLVKLLKNQNLYE